MIILLLLEALGWAIIIVSLLGIFYEVTKGVRK